MSPRVKKPRNCTCPFRGGSGGLFKPSGLFLCDLDRIIIHRDEIEAMFLCDSEDLSQEEAGKRMGVSRGTVQRLVARARKKTIEAVVLGKALVTEGLQQRHQDPVTETPLLRGAPEEGGS